MSHVNQENLRTRLTHCAWLQKFKIQYSGGWSLAILQREKNPLKSIKNAHIWLHFNKIDQASESFIALAKTKANSPLFCQLRNFLDEQSRP